MPSSSELVLTSARSRPALSDCSSDESTFARQRSVIRQRELFAGERVDPRRHLLGLRAVVDEDERRARAAHVAQHERCDRRPDRSVDVREIVDRRLDRRARAA